MKKTAFTMAACLVLVVLLAAAAQAQTAHLRLIANIPFQFNVGDKTLPAGEYIVTQVNPASDHAVLQLRSQNGNDGVVIQMNNLTGKANQHARMVFHRYGSQYYFAEIWTGGDGNGLQATKTKAERTLSQELARGQQAAETIALTRR